jgi:hypothetical protein
MSGNLLSFSVGLFFKNLIQFILNSVTQLSISIKYCMTLLLARHSGVHLQSQLLEAGGCLRPGQLGQHSKTPSLKKKILRKYDIDMIIQNLFSHAVRSELVINSIEKRPRQCLLDEDAL